MELENFRQAEKEVGRWSMVTDGKEEVTFHADVWFKGSSEKEKFILFGRRGRIKWKETYYLHIHPSELYSGVFVEQVMCLCLGRST